jgi:uncharacterized SAM-binding protein YcdF (DUF218 family)
MVGYFFTKSEKRKTKLLFAATIIYFLFTNVWVLNFFVNKWDIPPAQIEPEKEYSCAILLGGYTATDDKGNGYFTMSAQRFTAALQLYRQGKVQHILLTGGSGNLLKDSFNEADWARDQLIKTGIPASVILVERNSRSTLENAELSKKIIDSAKLMPPFVLVTSAFHMRRAAWVFEKEGMNVIPYACDDIIDKKKKPSFIDILPNIHVLDIWTFYIKEMIGLLVYKFEVKRLSSAKN